MAAARPLRRSFWAYLAVVAPMVVLSAAWVPEPPTSAALDDGDSLKRTLVEQPIIGGDEISPKFK
eukprot:scaffold45947_cov29-Tisochrysis_lutea.AAC.1